MTKTIRHLAVDILTQIQKSREFASPLLDDCLNKHHLSGTPDGCLLTHLVYGVLRLRGHLDWILTRLYRGNFEKLDEGVKNVLRVGLYQLKFSDRLPDFAVVNEAVKIAKIIRPDKSALVNAVLRNYLRRADQIPFPSHEKNQTQYIAIKHAHPLWLVKKWVKVFGSEETESLCSANNQLPPLTLRVNTLKISRAEIKQKLGEAGFDTKETLYSPDGLILNASASPVQKTDFFDAGFLRLQDEGGQLISYLFNAGKSSSILDACSGSGGKATHLAALMKNNGRIVAMDHSAERIAELTREVRRLGISIIEAQMADLSVELPDSIKEKFDGVLVDAPCSGTGTLRRNPEIKWRTTENDVTAFAVAQKNILQNASAAVKKGGRLIYCTCSLLPDENENIIEDFLKHHPGFSLCPPPDSIHPTLVDTHGFFHTYPQRHNMDGFFGAILIRS